MEKIDKKLLMPFILTFAVIIADQITKCLVVKYIEPWTIGAQFFGDILRIVRVANNGVAFSMGDSLSLIGRRWCFGLVPIIIMGRGIGVYFRNKEFTMLQRWAICGVVGGGIGNIIDRIFRVEGVIDFIDVKFYGIFGLQRWPTFNVADSAIIVFGILLAITFIISIKKDKSTEKSK